MNEMRKYVKLIESLSRKKPINEGVKIGKSEIINTLKNSKDYQMGIEYEFLTPNPDNRIQEADDFVQKYNISHVEKIVEEHDDMMEVVTTTMDINKGIQHIRHFFKSAIDYGITFPDTAGMHISISHKDANNKKFNFTKFLVLISGDYLHSIFPEREHVKNINDELTKLLLEIHPRTVGDFEDKVNELLINGATNSVGKKYVTTKLSDYIRHNGRVELRFFGGKDYNNMFNEIRTQLLRAVYILGIALDDNVYRKEYLTQLGKFIVLTNERNPKKAFEDIKNGNYSNNGDRARLENKIAKSGIYSLEYAMEVLKGRFEKGEDAIAVDAELSLEYAKKVLKGRFEKGEDAIATDPRSSHYYAKYVLKGERFEKGEDAISQDLTYSYLYALDVIGGRFEKGEDIIISDPYISIDYASDVIGGRFEKGEDIISENPLVSLNYARFVIKGRFKKGEQSIATIAEYSYNYAKDVVNGRFEKGEDAISKSAKYSLLYAKDVIKGRFEKGEESIKNFSSMYRERYYRIAGIQL